MSFAIISRYSSVRERARLWIDRHPIGQFGQSGQHDQQRARVKHLLVRFVVNLLGDLLKVQHVEPAVVPRDLVPWRRRRHIGARLLQVADQRYGLLQHLLPLGVADVQGREVVGRQERQRFDSPVAVGRPAGQLESLIEGRQGLYYRFQCRSIFAPKSTK